MGNFNQEQFIKIFNAFFFIAAFCSALYIILSIPNLFTYLSIGILGFIIIKSISEHNNQSLEDAQKTNQNTTTHVYNRSSEVKKNDSYSKHRLKQAASPFSSFYNYGNTGLLGEIKVSQRLNKVAQPCLILEDIMLPHRGKTSQIDHIAITQFGIFVIETKEYKGWIFGNENHKMWTQSLLGKQKHKFYNPIMQNRTHINALSSATSLSKSLFHNVVVFAGEANLKTQMPDNVVYLHGLLTYMGKFSKTVLQEDAIHRIYKQLDSAAISNSQENKKAHIDSIRKKYS